MVMIYSLLQYLIVMYLEFDDQSTETVSSYCPVYVRWSVKGEKSFVRPGANHTCICIPTVAAKNLKSKKKKDSNDSSNYAFELPENYML